MPVVNPSKTIYKETLAVFDDSNQPHEPLTTPEVTDALDCGRRAVYQRLEKLVDCGEIKTKKVGSCARVWWRPAPTNGTSTDPLSENSASPLSMAIDSIDVGVFILNADFEVAWINDATERYFDIKRSTVLGQDKHQLVHESLVDTIVEPDTFAETVLATYEDNTYTERFECRVLSRDRQKEHWLEHRSIPITSGPFAGGRIELYYDITDQKQTEHDLQEREQRLRRERKDRERRFEAIFKHTYQFTGLLEPDGTLLEANEAAQEFGGVDREDVVGKKVWNTYWFQHGDAAEHARAAVERARDGEFVREELDVQGADRIATIDFSIKPVTDDQGEVVFLVPEGRDITERKERERQLEEYRRWNQTLVENFPTGVVTLVNEDLRILTFAGAPQGVPNKTRADFEGELIRDVLPPEIADIVVPGYEAALDGDPVEFEETIDGRVYHYKFVPVCDDDGRVFAVTAMSQDITDRKERVRELESQREQLSTINDLHTIFQRVTDLVIEQSTRDGIEQSVCDAFANSDSYGFASMGHVSRDGRELSIHTTSGNSGRLLDSTVPLHEDSQAGPDPVAQAVNSQSIQTSQNIFDEPAFEDRTEGSERREYNAFFVPVVYEGRQYGVLSLYTERSVTDDVERDILERVGTAVGHAITAIEREKAILADSVIEAEYHSTELADPFVTVLNGDIQISIDRVVLLPGGGSLQYHTLRGISPAQYRDVVTEYPSMSSVRVLDEEGESSQVEIRTTDETMITVITTFNGRLGTVTIEDGELRMVVELPESADLREVTEAIQEFHPDVELLGHRTVTRQPLSETMYQTAVDDSFTDRQRSVIESAYAAGYFEWPRNVTAKELAASHDIHPSTFHNHLRRAEQKLVSTVFETSADPHN